MGLMDYSVFGLKQNPQGQWGTINPVGEKYYSSGDESYGPGPFVPVDDPMKFAYGKAYNQYAFGGRGNNYLTSGYAPNKGLGQSAMPYSPNDPNEVTYLTDWYKTMMTDPTRQQLVGDYQQPEWNAYDPGVLGRTWEGNRQRTYFRDGTSYLAEPYEGDSGMNAFAGKWMPPAVMVALAAMTGGAASAVGGGMAGAGVGAGMGGTTGFIGSKGDAKAGLMGAAGGAIGGYTATPTAAQSASATPASSGQYFQVDSSLAPTADYTGGPYFQVDQSLAPASYGAGASLSQTPNDSMSLKKILNDPRATDVAKMLAKQALNKFTQGMMGDMQTFSPQTAPQINTNYGQLPTSQLMNIGMIANPTAYTDPTWRPGITDVNTDPLNPNYATDYSIIKQKEMEEKRKKELAPDLQFQPNAYLTDYFA